MKDLKSATGESLEQAATNAGQPEIANNLKILRADYADTITDLQDNTVIKALQNKDLDGVAKLLMSRDTVGDNVTTLRGLLNRIGSANMKNVEAEMYQQLLNKSSDFSSGNRDIDVQKFSENFYKIPQEVRETIWGKKADANTWVGPHALEVSKEATTAYEGLKAAQRDNTTLNAFISHGFRHGGAGFLTGKAMWDTANGDFDKAGKDLLGALAYEGGTYALKNPGLQKLILSGLEFLSTASETRPLKGMFGTEGSAVGDTSSPSLLKRLWTDENGTVNFGPKAEGHISDIASPAQLDALDKMGIKTPELNSQPQFAKPILDPVDEEKALKSIYSNVNKWSAIDKGSVSDSTLDRSIDEFYKNPQKYIDNGQFIKNMVETNRTDAIRAEMAKKRAFQGKIAATGDNAIALAEKNGARAVNSPTNETALVNERTSGEIVPTVKKILQQGIDSGAISQQDATIFIGYKSKFLSDGTVTQKQIAQSLGLTESQISRSLSKTKAFLKDNPELKTVASNVESNISKRGSQAQFGKSSHKQTYDEKVENEAFNRATSSHKSMSFTLRDILSGSSRK